MELTVDQALQQGVAAHNEGKLQDAERLYRAILQAQPKHPDANHNLGVLAVRAGKPLEAVPLFELALEVNPQTEQFWLSYIDVLITLERFDEAMRALVEGEKSGVPSDKLDAVNLRLQESAPNDPNKTVKGQTLSEKRKRLADKKKSKKRKAQSPSSNAAPSQDQANHLLEHYQAGRLEEAEALAKLLTQKFPRHPLGWKALGLVFQQAGRLNDSLLPMQKSVELSPHDAEAIGNLGVTLHELGRLDEAEASYRQAIALEPGAYLQHNNLGNTLKRLGRFNEAEASLKNAIALKSDYAEAHSNLSSVLRELSRWDDAILACVHAIRLMPDFTEAYFNLASILPQVRFHQANRDIYPILINLLTASNFIRSRSVAKAILSLLAHDPLVKSLLDDVESISDLAQARSTIKTLDQVPLLHQLMRISPLPDLQFEALFVSMRRVLLTDLKQVKTSSESIHFLSTLSLHCFTNEYVYFETEEEAELIADLEAAIAESIAQASQPTITETLMLATYRPLHRYDWSKKLQALDQLPEVEARLLKEPFSERTIAENMPVLSSIDNDVSRKVREQYEESPYPRWVTLAIPPKIKSVAEICKEAKLHLHTENIKSVLSPSILIAGCGTGQHSIETASRFANCKVTAVDLSRTSLAYAQRKTSELGITNVKYLQADILNLGELGQEFDIIESAGVLHHMDAPMAGWRVLVDLLKNGGLMKIGLYSELARRPVVKTREDIALGEIGTSESEIKEFRQSLVESHNEQHQLLRGSTDFFSLSTLRDLIFHVQEHCFTLPKISRCLDELGLKFCGFESPNIVAKFKKSFGEKSDTCDLSLWHRFEEENPQTFAGMYQFWCQKL
jgi:tetratricopeptide (TPR) repeat protein/SAM-dependent methyltransferase